MIGKGPSKYFFPCLFLCLILNFGSSCLKSVARIRWSHLPPLLILRMTGGEHLTRLSWEISQDTGFTTSERREYHQGHKSQHHCRPETACISETKKYFILEECSHLTVVNLIYIINPSLPSNLYQHPTLEFIVKVRNSYCVENYVKCIFKSWLTSFYFNKILF